MGNKGMCLRRVFVDNLAYTPRGVGIEIAQRHPHQPRQSRAPHGALNPKCRNVREDKREKAKQNSQYGRPESPPCKRENAIRLHTLGLYKQLMHNKPNEDKGKKGDEPCQARQY